MPYTILVIDEEADHRELLAHSLQERLGYRIFSCATAEDAMQYFSTQHPVAKPDLMLFDWPNTGGEITVASLKSLTVYAPLVALVKYNDYDSGIAAINAGAQDFLTKPAAMERISTTFRNLLMFRDARREAELLRGDAASPWKMDNAGFLPSPYAFLGDDGNIRRMGDIESEIIRFAMQYYHGRMTEVAKRLGIGRSTLYRKLGARATRHAVQAA